MRTGVWKGKEDHYLDVLGDKAILSSLASLLRIPVDMHNVPAERVFRPSAWARFGTQEPQSADYRACSTYGPLYR